MAEPIIFESEVDFESILSGFDAIVEAASAASEAVASFGTAADGLVGLEDVLTAIENMTTVLSADLENLDYTLSQTAGSAQEAASGLESTGEAASVAGEHAASASEGFSVLHMNLLDGITTLGMHTLMFGMLAKGAVDLGMGLLAPSASMEQLQVAFGHLMGSTKGAATELQKLYSFAALTPFQFPDIASAAESMMGVGIAAKQIIPDITAIGDALSTVGQTSPASLQSVVFLMDKIQASGKLTAVSMMELGRHMLPAWKILEEGSGKTQAQLQALMKHGLGAADAMNWLITGMEKFGKGGMVDQAMTFNGLLTTFKDNLESAWRSFSSPLFDAAKQALVDLGNLVSSTKFQQFATSMGKDLSQGMEHLKPVFADVWEGFKALGDWMEKTGIPDFKLLGEWFMKIGLPALQEMASTVERNLLPPLETLAGSVANVTGAIINWVVQSGFLQTAVGDLSAILGTLVGWVADFIQGLQDSDPWVSALAGGLTAVATAIGLVKIEEFGAGIYNSFQQMQQGAGIVANLASKELPNLAQALGWTKVAAADTATAVEGVGTAATEAEATTAVAATGMTAAMGIATAGISLAIGIIAALWISTQNDITVGAHQMSQAVQKEYDSMGNSAADNAAKAKAAQISAANDTTNELRNQGSRASAVWAGSYDMQVRSADDAKAKMVLDQQKIADAAEAAAQAADNAWTKASQAMDLTALLKSAGWTDVEIAKYLGVPTASVASVPLKGAHAAGGINLPGGLSLVGEQGPELAYVPTGTSIIPNSVLQNIMSLSSVQVPSTGGFGAAGTGQIAHILLQILMTIQGQAAQGTPSSAPPNAGGSSSTTFNNTFNGVPTQQLYALYDTIAGKSQEAARRGSTAGII